MLRPTDSRSAGFAWRLGLALWLAGGLVCAATAPNRTGLDQNYLVDSWETDEGLPEGSTRQMVQTADGYLWFGTMGGLVRFDGVKFTVFVPENTPTLPVEGLINLHLDATGRLWVSTLGGLVVSERGRLTEFTRVAGWTGDYVRTFAENAGVLCLTSFNGKVFRATGQRCEELPKPPGTASGTYIGLVDRAGGLSVAQSGYYGTWDGQRWVESKIAADVTNGFRGIARAQDGTVVVCTAREILRIDGDRVISRETLSQTVPPAWQMTASSDGAVWLPTWGQGLYVVQPSGEVRRLTTANGLLADHFRFAFEDHEKNVWVGGGNGGGLSRIKRRTVVSYGTENGITERIVKAVAAEAPGKMLIGTFGQGLLRLENGRASPVPGANANGAGLFVQCLVVDRPGAIWIGTYGEGLQILSDGVRRQVALADSGGRNINGLSKDSTGRIWIGGSEGAVLYTQGRYVPQKLVTGAPMTHLANFAESPDDHVVWAANAGGLFRCDDGVWTEVLDPKGGSLRGILSLRAEADGVVWIGRAGIGLQRLAGGRWSSIGVAQGLPTLVIGSIVDDGLGYWWFGTNRGLIRVSRDDLERAADGTLATLPSLVFDRSDGLATSETTLGVSTRARRDGAGRLWFATPRGVAMVDPKALRFNTVPPPVRLEQVTYVDGAEKSHRVVPTAGVSLVLSAGSRKLEAHYAVLSHTAPEKVVLRHRFVRDGALISDEQQSGRTFQSDLLVHGNYSLAMTAANNDGVWNTGGANLAFFVAPFYWETTWFRSGVIILVLGLVGGGSWQSSQRRLRRQEAEMARERALAREHAMLASVLQGTSDFVAFASPEGKPSYINPAGRALARLGAEEDIGALGLRDLFPLATFELLMRVAIPHAMRHGTWTSEVTFQVRGRGATPVSMVLVAHRNAAHQLLFVSMILRDISEQKRDEQSIRRLNASLEERVRERTAELATRVVDVERLNRALLTSQRMANHAAAELQAANVQLRDANEELESFSYSVSHDLRAPLRNIAGFMELLTRRTAGTLDAESNRFVATVATEAMRMGQLIDDLLEFARINRREMKINHVDLGALVTEVREELLPEIGARRIEWKVSALPVLQGDRVLLRQVWVNLLSNAVKFTRQRDLAVIEIGVTAMPDAPEMVTVFIRDNGAGFNPRYQEKLFGVFQRLHNIRDFEGTGIGLANVKRVITRHGGQVRAEGVINQGATFYVSLPSSVAPR